MGPPEKTKMGCRFQVQEEWDQIEAAILERAEKDNWTFSLLTRLKALLESIGPKK